MSRLFDDWRSRVLLYGAIWALSYFPAWSAASDYALILPKASTSMLLDIAAANGRLVAAGERGHILYSDDQGVTWVQTKVPTSVMLTRIFFIDNSLGWAVGHDGTILASRDGGMHWELQRDGVTDQARINEERTARAKGLVDDLRTKLQSASGDASNALREKLDAAEHQLDAARETMNEPVYPPPLMDVLFADEAQGWSVGAFGVLLRTTSGGHNWEDWSYKVDNPDELHLNGIASSPDGTLYLASEWGYVFRSTTQGETWEPVATGYDGSFFGVVVNAATGSVFAYGLRGHIYRSVDQGASWEPVDSGATSSLFSATCDGHGTLLFVGQSGTIVRTADDGASFQPLDLGSDRGLYGVATTADGRIAVTGDGGSTLVVAAPGPRR